MLLVFKLYIVAYLDRANVGFAKLRMASDLRFSESVFGLRILHLLFAFGDSRRAAHLGAYGFCHHADGILRGAFFFPAW